MCGFRLENNQLLLLCPTQQSRLYAFSCAMQAFLQCRENYQSYDGLLIFDNFQAIPHYEKILQFYYWIL